MDKKLLVYNLTAEEVNFILQVLDKTQLSGVNNLSTLVGIVQKLQKPTNSDELDKEVYENLKKKFEPEDK